MARLDPDDKWDELLSLVLHSRMLVAHMRIIMILRYINYSQLITSWVVPTA
jgi:hypothetical protein